MNPVPSRRPGDARVRRPRLHPFLTSSPEGETIMVEVEITADTLAIILSGIDRFLAFKSRLEVPLGHVASARVGVDPAAKDQLDESMRLPGAYMPGIAIEGRFYRHGRWLFYAIHKGAHAITIFFHDEDYTAAVIEVEDPEATVRRIQEALATQATTAPPP
jgi:hypothetical protein